MARNTSKKTIAVFVNGWSIENINMFLTGICNEAKKDNVDVFVYASYILWGESAKTTNINLNLFRMVNPENFDGAILLSNTFNSPDEQTTILDRFKGSGVPLISAEIKLPGAAFVGTSNYKGMYELGRHLIETHHVKDVVYVSGIEGNEECAIRRKALEDALAEHGLIISDTINGHFSFFNASQAVDEWLEKGNTLPDAFACANDQMALGAASALHNRGIEVPGDVLVTGFDHVRDAQVTYPMIATVSRQWEQMGVNIYSELMQQIASPDPSYEHIYDTLFIPSESCGCKPKEDAVKMRLEKVRNVSYELTHNDMIEFMFQEVRVAMSKVESREQFQQIASDQLLFRDYIGNDYCVCTDPLFWDLGDDEYVPSSEGFPDEMEVLFRREKGSPTPQERYTSDRIYPGYMPSDDSSDVYVFTPLTHMDYNIGYVVIKNRPEVLYDLRFKKWINNMDTMLISIRQYMISRRLYNKLEHIYMTDFLTGMYNRTGCENVLFKYVDDERNAGNRTTLIFIDIDCMKTINDIYGHLNGDIAIKATVEAMRNTLPEDWLMGRFGGDEFVAVGPYSDDFDIEEYRDRFRANMKEVTDRMQVSFRLTASAGYCVIMPDTTGTIEDYIRNADVSMYKEKEKAHKAMDLDLAAH